MKTTTKWIFALALLGTFRTPCAAAASDPAAPGPGRQSISRILFARTNDGDRGWSIFAIDPVGGKEEVIVPFKSGMGEYNPDISPDGRTILFNTYRYRGWKLALFDIRGKQVTRITKSSPYFTNGTFSPDGERIAYERNVGRETHIFVAQRDGKQERRLSKGTGTENRIPAWTPDGTAVLYYGAKKKTNDIYRVDLESGAITNLSRHEPANDFGPAISPDGKQIAFFSDRNGHLDLFVMDATGSAQTNLTAELKSEHNEYNYYTDTNMYWMFKASWSPDGQSLVFTNSANGGIELFTIGKDGTDLTQITDSLMPSITPVWGTVIE